MIMRGLAHAKADWDDVEERVGVARGDQVGARVEGQFVVTRCKIGSGQDLTVRAPVVIRDDSGNMFAASLRDTVQVDLHTFCRQSACRVENVGGEIASHVVSLLFVLGFRVGASREIP